MATEKWLIDANRLLRDPYFQEGRYPESHLLRMAVREQPTVDAVEVVRGWWSRGHDVCFCSVCGFDISTIDDFNYCPNCGAKMDGGVTNAQ